MPETTRRAKTGSHTPPEPGFTSDMYEQDVLLIADEPRHLGHGWRQPAQTGELEAERGAQVEPLDMETVVRKLIALLREDSQP